MKLTNSNEIKFDPLVINVAGLGERILYSSSDNFADAGGFDLFSMKPDGSSVTRLTTNSLFDAFCTEWYGTTSGSAALTVRSRFKAPHPQAGHTFARPQWQ